MQPVHHPVNTRCWSNVGWMLAHRLWPWTHIDPTSGQTRFIWVICKASLVFKIPSCGLLLREEETFSKLEKSPNLISVSGCQQQIIITGH